MRPIIFQVHFHGIYYAGDHIDIHDNTSVNFYQGENTKKTNTTRRMGYTRIETERAGRRACAKARATTGTALVKHYALRYAFPKN